MDKLQKMDQRLEIMQCLWACAYALFVQVLKNIHDIVFARSTCPQEDSAALTFFRKILIRMAL